MKVGNRGQAIALGIGAVLALGFLIHTAVSTFSPGTPVGLVLGAAEHPDATMVQIDHRLPDVVTRDAFAHPALLSDIAIVNHPKDPDKPQSTPKTPMLPPLLGVVPEVADAVRPASKPKESTGSDQYKGHGPAVSIKLVAIVSADGEAAFLSVDGGSSRPFSKGDGVTQGITVTAIGPDGVRLSMDGRSVHLSVGDEAKL